MARPPKNGVTRTVDVHLAMTEAQAAKCDALRGERTRQDLLLALLDAAPVPTGPTVGDGEAPEPTPAIAVSSQAPEPRGLAGAGTGGVVECDDDPLYAAALALLPGLPPMWRISASWLQRHLKTGYHRAAMMIERLHREGYVGPSERGMRPVVPWPGASDPHAYLDDPEEVGDRAEARRMDAERLGPVALRDDLPGWPPGPEVRDRQPERHHFECTGDCQGGCLEGAAMRPAVGPSPAGGTSATEAVAGSGLRPARPRKRRRGTSATEEGA